MKLPPRALSVCLGLASPLACAGKPAGPPPAAAKPTEPAQPDAQPDPDEPTLAVPPVDRLPTPEFELDPQSLADAFVPLRYPWANEPARIYLSFSSVVVPHEGLLGRLAREHGHEGWQQVTFDTQEALELLGEQALPQLWMFGSEGPCEAQISALFLDVDRIDYRHEEEYELAYGFVLEPCGEDYGPFVFVRGAHGVEPPPLRWVEASPATVETIHNYARWRHERRSVYNALGFHAYEPDPDQAQPEHLIRESSAGPAFAALDYGYYWPASSCEDQAGSFELNVGLWSGSSFHPLAPLAIDEGNKRYETAGLLMGGFYQGDSPYAVVLEWRFDRYLGFVEPNTDDPAGALTVNQWFTKVTGAHHEEDLYAWTAWSPLDEVCDAVQ